MVCTVQFPSGVRALRLVGSSLSRPPRPVPRKRRCVQGKSKREQKKMEQKKGRPARYSSSSDAMNEAVDRNSGCFSRTPIPSLTPSAPAFTLPSSSLSQRSLSSHSDTSLPSSPCPLGGSTLPSSHIRNGVEIQQRLAAPSVRTQISDLPAALPLPSRLPHLHRHDRPPSPPLQALLRSFGSGSTSTTRRAEP